MGGMTRLLAGVVFSLGLILVIVGGAELNWLLVYVGNFVGALATAFIVYVARAHEFGAPSVRPRSASPRPRAVLWFWQAVALGVLCNALVCLAVWLTYSAPGSPGSTGSWWRTTRS